MTYPKKRYTGRFSGPSAATKRLRATVVAKAHQNALGGQNEKTLETDPPTSPSQPAGFKRAVAREAARRGNKARLYFG